MVLFRAFYFILIFGLFAIKALCMAFSALLSSQYAELNHGLVWANYGAWCLTVDRDIPKSDMNGNENDMTSSQLVPICLLSSTMITFSEAYDGKRCIQNISNPRQS